MGLGVKGFRLQRFGGLGVKGLGFRCLGFRGLGFRGDGLFDSQVLRRDWSNWWQGLLERGSIPWFFLGHQVLQEAFKC